MDSSVLGLDGVKAGSGVADSKVEVAKPKARRPSNRLATQEEIDAGVAVLWHWFDERSEERKHIGSYWMVAY